MSKNIHISAKIYSTLLALVFSLKYIFLRRFLPFKKLVKKKVAKNNHLNFSSYLVIKAANFIFRTVRIRSCFTRSLVISEMLFLCGIENAIEIGINESNNNISSHCWVRIRDFYTEPEHVRKKYKVLSVE